MAVKLLRARKYEFLLGMSHDMVVHLLSLLPLPSPLPVSLHSTFIPSSRLHTNLIEHLNAEVVLHTITDVSVALQWLKSTFLFVRIKQNPKHYGIPEHLSPGKLEEKLQDMCLKDLQLLEAHGLINMVDGFDVKPTGE